jgi:ribosomal-protein-alanine N-acetyltransferase
VAPKYARQGMATEAANAAIRYAFGHHGAKAISIGYFDGNEPSRRIVEKLGLQKVGVEKKRRQVASMARNSIVMNTS